MTFIRTLAGVLFASAFFFTGRAAENAAVKPPPDARFGNVLFKTPDAGRWTVSERSDRRIYAASLPAPDFATITVFAGEKLAGDFASAFGRAVTQNLRELRSEKIERDGGVQASQAAEGFDVLQRTIVAEGPGFHTHHWFLAGHSGDRFDLIAFQTSSEEMYRHYGQDAADFFYSVKLANSLPANSTVVASVAAGSAVAPRAVMAQTNPATTNLAPKGTAPATRFGPLVVGSKVEVPWAGGWTPGVVLNVEGLTYFVHFGAETDEGKYDDFFTLELIRPPGGAKTYAETFRDTMPDPDGGPIAIGGEVEYNDGRWNRMRVARRLGERYVIFADKPGSVTEVWTTLDKLRPVGGTAPFAPERPFKPRQPASLTEIRAGDVVEAHPRRGFWGALTVLAHEGSSYFVKIAPYSGLSMRGWVDASHMRAVGAKEPFQAEDLTFFVGRWKLTGDSFQTLVDRKVSGGKVTETYQNNSGAGQNAGGVTVNADGTYQLMNTVVYHDGKGRWERNPNQDEGGILLRGADGKGDKDCVITNHQDGFAYLQGSIRGPGKWCTRIGR